MRRVAVTVAAIAAFSAAVPSSAPAKPDKETSLQLLAINDFHGNLEPPSGSSGRIATGPTTTVDAGGVDTSPPGWTACARTTPTRSPSAQAT